VTVVIKYNPQDKIALLADACSNIFYRVGQIQGCIEVNEVIGSNFRGGDYIRNATEEISVSVEKIIEMIEAIKA
jgi:hypothetical protein